MKKLMIKIVSLVLALTMLFATAIQTVAARPGTQFLSEIQMAQAKTPEEAKKMLTDAGYKVIDKNLNPEGDAVYLGYKTSSNVEDAITDIAVMNMDGGYSISDYQTVLKETLAEYTEMVGKYRTVANEFAANYRAGDKDAQLAYRQLNYYYVEKNGVKTKMGDYMLNFPADDSNFADILMKGNVFIQNNIRSLLSMGVGESGTSLADKIAALTKDESVYDKHQYHNDAKSLYEILADYENKIKETDSIMVEINDDETMTQEEKDDAICQLLDSVANMLATKSIIENFAYGDSTYGAYLEANTVVTDYSVFYPIIDAMTEGQRIMASYGQLADVLVYDNIKKDDIELESELQEIESEFKELDVYLGTDMSIFEGSFAVTTTALRYEAATGKSWMREGGMGEAATDLFANTLLGVGGLTIIVASTACLENAAQAAYSAYNTFSLNPEYLTLVESAKNWGEQVVAAKNAVEFAAANSVGGKVGELVIKGTERQLQGLMENYTNVTTMMKSTPEYIRTPGSISVGPIVFSAIGVVVGAVILGFSISNIIKILNSYNIDYTDIPTNMVDCVETEYGDRFIRYSVVNSFYKDGDDVEERAGDTNAYNGQQWVALYYTKSYEAGKCMVATPDIPTTETDFGRYTPVHAFGTPDACYNLNKYSTKEGVDPTIFLAFANSNLKKAAATSVPDVVGSIFNYGMIALSGVAGIGVGMGIMAAVKSKKKKANED